MKHKIATLIAAFSYCFIVLLAPVSAYAQAYGRGSYSGEAYQCSVSNSCATSQSTGSASANNSGGAPALNAPEQQTPGQAVPATGDATNKTQPLVSDIATATSDNWQWLLLGFGFFILILVLFILIHRRRKDRND